MERRRGVGYDFRQEPEKKEFIMGVFCLVLLDFVLCIERQQRCRVCACACLHEPLYWNAGPRHSAAHSFNFCKQTNSRRAEDHTASLMKH